MNTTRVKNYLLKFIFAQLIVTLISLPVLISWGLPISSMSLVGNFLFSPLITIFLILSSFIFFTELLGIPNYFLGAFLNWLTRFLEYLLSFGSKNWLISFPLPKNKLILLLIPTIGVLIITSKKIKNIKNKIALLSVFLLLIVGYLKYFSPIQQGNSSPLEKLEIIKNKEDSINITDLGLFNKKVSINDYINFEILPFISKNYGNPTIKNLTLSKPTGRSFKAIMELCKRFKIERVKINLKDVKLSKYGWRCFFALKKVLRDNKTALLTTK